MSNELKPLVDGQVLTKEDGFVVPSNYDIGYAAFYAHVFNPTDRFLGSAIVDGPNIVAYKSGSSKEFSGIHVDLRYGPKAVAPVEPPVSYDLTFAIDYFYGEGANVVKVSLARNTPRTLAALGTVVEFTHSHYNTLVASHAVFEGNNIDYYQTSNQTFIRFKLWRKNVLLSEGTFPLIPDTAEWQYGTPDPVLQRWLYEGVPANSSLELTALELVNGTQTVIAEGIFSNEFVDDSLPPPSEIDINVAVEYSYGEFGALSLQILSSNPSNFLGLEIDPIYTHSGRDLGTNIASHAILDWDRLEPFTDDVLLRIEADIYQNGLFIDSVQHEIRPSENSGVYLYQNNNYFFDRATVDLRIFLLGGPTDLLLYQRSHGNEQGFDPLPKEMGVAFDYLGSLFSGLRIHVLDNINLPNNGVDRVPQYIHSGYYVPNEIPSNELSPDVETVDYYRTQNTFRVAYTLYREGAMVDSSSTTFLPGDTPERILHSTEEFLDGKYTADIIIYEVVDGREVIVHQGSYGNETPITPPGQLAFTFIYDYSIPTGLFMIPLANIAENVFYYDRSATYFHSNTQQTVTSNALFGGSGNRIPYTSDRPLRFFFQVYSDGQLLVDSSVDTATGNDHSALLWRNPNGGTLDKFSVTIRATAMIDGVRTDIASGTFSNERQSIGV